MKFLISSAFLMLMFSASAGEMTTVNASKEATQTIVSVYPGGPGKGKRKNKRINKKRKRKCQKWGRKSFAG